MGTTATALATQPGVRAVWVLAIEGYEYLITDHSDLAAVVTAWSEASEWSAALGGLFVTSAFEQSMNPWDPFVAAGDLTFVVRDVDGSDTFGRAVFQRGGGNETYLDAVLDNDATSATVKDSDHFSASGTVYIGTERVTYTSRSGATISGLTRGRCAPFAADTESVPRFGRYHRAGVSTRSTGVNAIVSSLPRTWHGKWVGLWMHRVVGGVLDTRGQAQLVWAGTIAEVTDAANGDTQVTCKHVTAKIPETVLLRDPWSAEANEGVYLAAGDTFDFRMFGNQNLDPLVVTVGASGAYQIEAGYHTVETMLTALNGWAAAGLADDDIDESLSFSVEDVNGVGLFTIRFNFNSVDGGNTWAFWAPATVMAFLGFSAASAPTDDDGRGKVSGDITTLKPGTSGGGPLSGSLVRRADTAPLVSSLWSQFQATDSELTVINVAGTFINQLESMPRAIRDELVPAGTTTGTWGFLWVEGVLFLAEVTVSGTNATIESIKRVNAYQPLSTALANQQIRDVGSRTQEEGAGPVVIHQVVILEDSFAQLVPRLLASTGSLGYNHATYDEYDYGLGCEIPWELLGQSFLDSCAVLDQSGGTIRVVLDKPTELGDLIGADLAMRKASLVWKNGGLRFTAWSSLTASRALHALTEDNKGAPVDQQDAQRTPLIATDQWLRNVLKVEHDREMFANTYHAVFQWEDRASIDDVGEERPFTVHARNSYQAAGDVISELAAGLFSSMTFFSRPVLMLRRTIDMSLFEGVAPGDLVTVTDLFARDPSTGERGLDGKPGIVIAHRWSPGGADPSNPSQPRPMFGEIDIAVDAVDRTFAWAPAAMVDENAFSGGFTAGYNSATNTIRCKANEYTLSADGVVDVTYFEVGDEVLVVEVDPSGGTSQTWARAILSKSSNDLTLTAALTGFDTAKRYRVVPQDYASVGADLRDVAYQADSTDARVQDTAPPYLWGEEYGLETNQPPAWVQTALPERYSSSSFGDGIPLDVGFETGLINMAINLMAYKTAPQVPCLDAQARNHSSVSGWKLHAVIPYFVGPTTFPLGYTRRLYVAPFFRSSGGAAVQVRVTLTKNPPRGDSLQDVELDVVSLANFAIFATSSTSFVKSTAVGLRVEPAGAGDCFLIVEVDHSQAQVYGLAEVRLGALESA
jgi:hypothetical protein